MVVIDSLNGYLNAMPDGRFLILQMHELLSYLNQQGVLTILVLAQHGLVGPMDTPLDISYLSDAVLMLRYFEYDGTVRRALSVVKKRSGDHEHTIREFRLSARRSHGRPAADRFSGIFTGTPHYTGDGARYAGRRTWRRLTSERARVLILAPIGRDGAGFRGPAARAGLPPTSVATLQEVVTAASRQAQRRRSSPRRRCSARTLSALLALGRTPAAVVRPAVRGPDQPS